MKNFGENCLMSQAGGLVEVDRFGGVTVDGAALADVIRDRYFAADDETFSIHFAGAVRVQIVDYTSGFGGGADEKQ